jgi:acyl-CoA synthetase (AMP-forming)/AMP-acid ligase II
MRIERRIAAAAANPAAIAIDGGAGERLTHGALASTVVDLARSLRSIGTRPGSRVALVFENDPCVPVALLAVLRCGACAVPLNARLAEAELDAILAHADPSVVLFAERGAEHCQVCPQSPC